jgi:predicted transposase/invertase (TIGR01784 family)
MKRNYCSVVGSKTGRNQGDKMVTDQIHKGDDYDKIQKCIHVSILDFVHFPEDSRCYRKITFCDTKTGEVYTDVMEIHVLELGKLPPEDQNEEGIIRWMRFLNAKSRKELKEMAKQDEYFGEAYEELDRLSADEKKRLEYETRLKYKRDKYAQLHYATRIGREEGERIGREEGAKQINELHKRLIELGRIDDLKRAVEDSDYQGRLLKELKL